MTIEVAFLITVVSIFCTKYSASRNAKKDTQAEQAEQTTIIVKLETIATGITEIKNDMRSVKNDVQEHDRRITRLEESRKQAHKRLDDLTKGER